MYEGFIREYPNSLTDEFCRKTIEKFEQDKGNHRIGRTYRGIDLLNKNTVEIFVSNNQNWMEEDAVLKEALTKGLSDYYKDIPPEYNFGNMYMSGIRDRGYQIQKYFKNVGFYDWHQDFHVDNNDASFRVLTFIWYLNDVEEGGETEFTIGVKVKPQTGKLLIFPSTWGTQHRGIMPVSHDKYIITGWIYYRYPY